MIVYFIKSTFLLLVSSLIFKVNLENKKSLKLIRFYLMGALILAFVIPLFNFQFLVTKNAIVETKEYVFQHIPQIPLDLVANVDEKSVSMFTVMYVIVCGGFALKFIYNLSIILKLKRYGKIVKTSFGTILTHAKVKTPFTFHNLIYINENDWNNNKVDNAIIYHEQAHVKQKHSIDILFIEILKIFFWFQPFLYYFKRIIQENHEYLADEFTLQKVTNIKYYQQLIVNYYSNNQTMIALSSSIHFNNLKKRFIMMKNKRKGRVWETICYSSIVLLTYIGFVGIEAKASEIKKAEDKMSTVIENAFTEPEKVLDALANKTKNSEKSQYDSFVIIKFKRGQNYTGTFVHPTTKDLYLYLVSPDQSSVLVRNMSNKEKILTDISKHNIKFKLIEKEEDNTRFESNNDPIILAYIKGEKSSGYFTHYKDVFFYVVDENLKVSIYNRYGILQNEKEFSYQLKAVSKTEKEKLTVDELNKTSQLKKDYEEKRQTEILSQDVHKFVDKKAAPKEGLQSFMQNFVKEFKAPKEIDSDEIKIVLRFIVESDGSFSNIYTPQELFKPSDSYVSLKEEAIRVLETMPKWNPAEHEGKIVRSTFALPITIKLKADKLDNVN